MDPKKKSKHLDIPAESNRDKHVNFLAQENGEPDPGADSSGDLFDDKDYERRENESEDEYD